MDLLGGTDDALFAALNSFFHSPVERLGWPLAAASIAIGLVMRWVRRATSA